MSHKITDLVNTNYGLEATIEGSPVSCNSLNNLLTLCTIAGLNKAVTKIRAILDAYNNGALPQAEVDQAKEALVIQLQKPILKSKQCIIGEFVNVLEKVRDFDGEPTRVIQITPVIDLDDCDLDEWR